MHKKIIEKTVKATIINIIVALCFTIAVVGIIYLFYGAKIEQTISIVSKIAIDTEKAKTETLPTIITEENGMENYPKYGEQYATIEIPKIDVNLPVYFGERLDILKKGVGHLSNSYFPGEGGSVIYMGHNTKNMFRRFSELKKDDMITVKTSYGEYNYKIYDMQIINETEMDKMPIQKQKEILMVFTCYPFINIGYTKQRYVVYAELQK